MPVEGWERVHSAGTAGCDGMTTEKHTIKDLHCENCNKCEKNPNDDYFCAVTNTEIDFTDFESTKLRGCASHPLALQVLAAPVIEELEMRVAEYQETAKRIECPHPSYVASGIEEAIKLLKERVDNGEVPP